MSNPGTNSAPAPEAPASSALSDGGLSEMFSPEGQSGSATGTEGAQVQPVPVEPGVPDQPEPVAPAAPVASAQPVPPADNTARELQALRDEISQLRNPPKLGPDGKPEAAPPDPLRTVPDYNFDLPLPLMDQLNDPDPQVRKAALSATISATARVVHTQVLNQMQGLMREMMQAIPRMTGETLSETETQRQVTTDFYGKYGEYNTPMLRPLVQMALLEVAKANPDLAKRGWTPELRDKLGEFLKATVPVPARAAAGAVPPKAPAAPPTLMGTGSRPAVPVVPGDENGKALAEMFG